MRPATALAVGFGGLAVTIFVVGLFGVFETVPGFWRNGWPVVVVVHTLLAMVFGYYVLKTR